MRKETVPVLIVGVLALIGLFFLIDSVGKKEQPFNTQTVQKNAIQVQKKTISDNSASIGYQISATYPEILGLKNSQTQNTINVQVYSFIEETINTFKENITINQQNVKIPAQIRDGMNELDITYTTGRADDTVVSYLFQTMDSEVGMAHPANTNATYTFDSQTGRKLSLSDLFYPNSNYLEKISELVKTQLNQKFAGQMGASDFINEGAAPKESNYKNFVLTTDSLQIVFDPASVAPDFAGTQIVSIPLTSLIEIMQPEYL